MEATAKKARRLPEVLVAQPQVAHIRSKSQLPTANAMPQHHLPIHQIQQQLPLHQPYHFQQPKRASSVASVPQVHHFYHQQVQQSQQPQLQPQQQQQQAQVVQRIHHLQVPQQVQPQQVPPPTVRRLHGTHYVKKGDELFVDLSIEREAPSQASVTSTWPAMLPASLTMPLHPVSAGFSGVASSAGNVLPSSVIAPGPVRRVGAKRVAGPDDWRLASTGSPGPSAGNSNSNMSYTPPPHASAGSSGAPFMVSPVTFAGPVNVTVNNMSLRGASPSPSPSTQCPPARASPMSNGLEHLNTSRATAIEKRRMKLKEVSAAYETELQAACQRLLALQREWREECESEEAKENGFM